MLGSAPLESEASVVLDGDRSRHVGPNSCGKIFIFVMAGQGSLVRKKSTIFVSSIIASSSTETTGSVSATV